jgi:hypothetical protein
VTLISRVEEWTYYITVTISEKEHSVRDHFRIVLSSQVVTDQSSSLVVWIQNLQANSFLLLDVYIPSDELSEHHLAHAPL